MRGQTRTAGALAMAVLLAASSGCATVLRGSSTSLVRIHSDPPGARVMVDGEEVGVTPVVAPLSRRRSAYRLRLEKDGCFPAEHELRRSTSPWTIVTAMHAVTSGLGAGQEGFHGFLLGPAIVFSVDAFSGAMFELPRTVQVALRADMRGDAAGETSGKCGTDISATGGGVSIPLSVPLDVPGNLLPPRGRLAVDGELRRRLRAVRLALPGPLVGSQPGVSMSKTAHFGERQLGRSGRSPVKVDRAFRAGRVGTGGRNGLSCSARATRRPTPRDVATRAIRHALCPSGRHNVAGERSGRSLRSVRWTGPRSVPRMGTPSCGSDSESSPTPPTCCSTPRERWSSSGTRCRELCCRPWRRCCRRRRRGAR